MRVLYPFLFTSDEDWEVNVCMEVPEGYVLAGILDENEEVVTVEECANAFVAGESQVFLFEVEDVASPEPEMAFGLTTRHDGKTKKVQGNIRGVRKWTEEGLERKVHKKVKKLSPKWKKRTKGLMQKKEMRRGQTSKTKEQRTGRSLAH